MSISTLLQQIAPAGQSFRAPMHFYPVIGVHAAIDAQAAPCDTIGGERTGKVMDLMRDRFERGGHDMGAVGGVDQADDARSRPAVSAARVSIRAPRSAASRAFSTTSRASSTQPSDKASRTSANSRCSR